MNEEKQRILIAEACGWKFQKIRGEFRFIATSPNGEVTHQNYGEIHFLPNYPQDLNACHEMEKTLSSEKYGDYTNHLAKVCHPFSNERPHSAIQVSICATAPQRCEAFLKTVGKWEE